MCNVTIQVSSDAHALPLQAFGVGEAMAATALSGVVGKMTKKREELYKSDAMKAVAKVSAIPTYSDDVSVPYDAAAQLAYKAAGSPGGDFETFQATFKRQCVGIAKMKKCQRDGTPVPAWVTLAADGVDLSIPYDATAKNAYKAAGSKGDFGVFKKKYLADAVAAVAAKQ